MEKGEIIFLIIITPLVILMWFMVFVSIKGIWKEFKERYK